MKVRVSQVLFTIITTPMAYIYPVYATYCVLTRPAQATTEADKNRWLKYWAILACFRVGEMSLQWILQWLPLYWFFKTLFLLYLAFPFRRTAGAGANRLYDVALHPALALIDHNINALHQTFKAIADFAIEGARTVSLWALAVAREAIRTAIAAANAVPTEPGAGSAGAARGAEEAAGDAGQESLLAGGSGLGEGHAGIRQRNVGTSNESIEERRRRLEAELAELNAIAEKMK